MSCVASQLFKNRYRLRLEERAFYSDEWLSEIGVMGVNSMEEAEVHLKRLREVKITIPQICDYYKSGYAMQFVDVKDAAEIFDIINRHLNNWLQIVTHHGYVNPIPPIEDFESLDDLAELLYAYSGSTNGMTAIFKLFKSPFAVADSLKRPTGMYSRYSIKLYKYCQLVWGENHAST